MPANEIASLPHFARGRMPRFLMGMLLLSGLMLLSNLVGPLFGFPAWFQIAGWILYAIALPLLIVWFVTPMPKALARVRRGELPCWHCGYDLRHCTEPRCPECGHDLNAQDLQAKWDEAITRANRKRR